MSHMKREFISVEVSPKMKLRLRQFAKKGKVTVSWYIREVLRDHLVQIGARR